MSPANRCSLFLLSIHPCAGSCTMRSRWLFRGSETPPSHSTSGRGRHHSWIVHMSLHCVFVSHCCGVKKRTTISQEIYAPLKCATNRIRLWTVPKGEQRRSLGNGSAEFEYTKIALQWIIVNCIAPWWHRQFCRSIAFEQMWLINIAYNRAYGTGCGHRTPAWNIKCNKLVVIWHIFVLVRSAVRKLTAHDAHMAIAIRSTSESVRSLAQIRWWLITRN